MALSFYHHSLCRCRCFSARSLDFAARIFLQRARRLNDAANHLLFSKPYTRASFYSVSINFLLSSTVAKQLLINSGRIAIEASFTFQHTQRQKVEVFALPCLALNSHCLYDRTQPLDKDAMLFCTTDDSTDERGRLLNKERSIRERRNNRLPSIEVLYSATRQNEDSTFLDLQPQRLSSPADRPLHSRITARHHHQPLIQFSPQRHLQILFTIAAGSRPFLFALSTKTSLCWT